MSNGNGGADANKVRVQTFFIYPVPLVTLAPAAVGTSTVRIESATDFIWFKSAYWADNNAATGQQTEDTRIVPSVDVQVNVSGADRNLFNAPIPIPSFCGHEGLPFVSPAPMILLASSELRFDFTSRESARTLQIRLALIGLKDYGLLERAPPQFALGQAGV